MVQGGSPEIWEGWISVGVFLGCGRDTSIGNRHVSHVAPIELVDVYGREDVVLGSRYYSSLVQAARMRPMG